MKKPIFFLVLVSFTFGLYAQKNVQNIKVTYNHFVAKADFPKPYSYSIKTYLLITDSVGQYVYDRPEKKVKEANYQTRIIAHKYINNYYFKKGITEEQRSLTNGIIKAKWKPNYKWEISDETKIINGYLCTKATTQSIEIDTTKSSYYGKAIAWFTKEIPVLAGPDRYNGLPGLILKIEYEKSQKNTTVEKIEFNTGDKLIDISKGVLLQDKDDVIFAFFKNPKVVRSALKTSKN